MVYSKFKACTSRYFQEWCYAGGAAICSGSDARSTSVSDSRSRSAWCAGSDGWVSAAWDGCRTFCGATAVVSARPGDSAGGAYQAATATANATTTATATAAAAVFGSESESCDTSVCCPASPTSFADAAASPAESGRWKSIVQPRTVV